MKVQIRIEETLSKIVEVEADNNIDAVSKVANNFSLGSKSSNWVGQLLSGNNSNMPLS